MESCRGLVIHDDHRHLERGYPDHDVAPMNNLHVASNCKDIRDGCILHVDRSRVHAILHGDRDSS